jgi:hypothetical protein
MNLTLARTLGAEYPLRVPAVVFSSSLCDRLMLRQPSAYLHTPRGEGCSSTAFDHPHLVGVSVWINPATRGSDTPTR